MGSERITDAMLDSKVEYINKFAIADKLSIGGAYNQTYIYADVNGHSQSKHMTCGTKRHCYEYLQAFEDGCFACKKGANIS